MTDRWRRTWWIVLVAGLVAREFLPALFWFSGLPGPITRLSTPVLAIYAGTVYGAGYWMVAGAGIGLLWMYRNRLRRPTALIALGFVAISLFQAAYRSWEVVYFVQAVRTSSGIRPIDLGIALDILILLKGALIIALLIRSAPEIGAMGGKESPRAIAKWLRGIVMVTTVCTAAWSVFGLWEMLARFESLASKMILQDFERSNAKGWIDACFGVAHASAVGILVWAIGGMSRFGVLSIAPVGRCMRCGYDLGGLRGDICPECGRSIPVSPS